MGRLTQISEQSKFCMTQGSAQLPASLLSEATRQWTSLGPAFQIITNLTYSQFQSCTYHNIGLSCCKVINHPVLRYLHRHLFQSVSHAVNYTVTGQGFGAAWPGPPLSHSSSLCSLLIKGPATLSVAFVFCLYDAGRVTFSVAEERIRDGIT